MCVIMEATKSTPTTHKELRGSVLDVLRELLSGRRDEDILALVSKLVARNNELELLLAKMRESKNRGERVSSAQLDLFLDKLREQSEGELQQANDKLEQREQIEKLLAEEEDIERRTREQHHDVPHFRREAD